MHLRLERVQKDDDVTIGRLFVDDMVKCWILEDPVREIAGAPVSEWKVPGSTAIPRGTYAVDITPSQRFHRDLPLLLAVPGFEGIRIHPGNSTTDTEGCLLPGAVRLEKTVGGSRLAFDTLFAMLQEAKRAGEPIDIEIV